MNAINDLCTRDERLMQMASKGILTDAWPFAFVIAVVLFLGFAIGYQAGFKKGAEQSLFLSEHSGKVPSGE